LVESSLTLDPENLAILEQAFFLTQEQLQTFASAPLFNQKIYTSVWRSHQPCDRRKLAPAVGRWRFCL
ncbi:MAG: hypothetical protein ACRDEA_08725, partial [Microcystaceae cyanobacterium]